MRRCYAVLALALSGCASLENRLVYFPTPAAPDRAPLPAPLEDLTLVSPDGAHIHARWCPNDKTDLVILYCHGNGGNLDGWGRVAHDFHQKLNASVLLFDYPGYGRSTGKPSESGCYAAAHAAYDWLIKEQKILPKNIVLCGESLGGGVATELAARNQPRALILIRTFTSLPDVAQSLYPWLPCDSWMVNRFNSDEHLVGCTSPLFIAQADEDRIIPFEHAKSLQAKHGSRYKGRPRSRLFTLRGLGHNDPLPENFYAALRNFLSQVE